MFVIFGGCFCMLWFLLFNCPFQPTRSILHCRYRERGSKNRSNSFKGKENPFSSPFVEYAIIIVNLQHRILVYFVAHHTGPKPFGRCKVVCGGRVAILHWQLWHLLCARLLQEIRDSPIHVIIICSPLSPFQNIFFHPSIRFFQFFQFA